MNLTTKQITFLRDVPSGIKVDKTSGWRHHYFDGFNIHEISSYIKLIENDKIYLVIPFFSSSKSLSNARLRLSDPFLINNKSNPALIAKFLYDQWNSSGFNNTTLLSFSFEFKRVWFTEF